jgi:hypothetical protein
MDLYSPQWIVYIYLVWLEKKISIGILKHDFYSRREFPWSISSLINGLQVRIFSLVIFLGRIFQLFSMSRRNHGEMKVHYTLF